MGTKAFHIETANRPLRGTYAHGFVAVNPGLILPSTSWYFSTQSEYIKFFTMSPGFDTIIYFLPLIKTKRLHVAFTLERWHLNTYIEDLSWGRSRRGRWWRRAACGAAGPSCGRAGAWAGSCRSRRWGGGPCRCSPAGCTAGAPGTETLSESNIAFQSLIGPAMFLVSLHILKNDDNAPSIYDNDKHNDPNKLVNRRSM